MKRLMIVLAAAAMLAACGTAAADDDREVASLSTTAVGVDSGDTGDTTGDTTGDGETDTTGPIDPTEGPLKFAQCMREHGIDMPDPTINADGGVLVQVGGSGGVDAGTEPDPKDMEAAHEDCQHFLDDGGGTFEPPSEEDQKKMQEEALEYSKCMREHGIDMPDPQFSSDGRGFNVSIRSPDGGASDGPPIDFESDEFNEASEACGRDGNGGFSVSIDEADG